MQEKSMRRKKKLPAKAPKEDPVVVERRAIREAGRRRLRGEVPAPSLSTAAAVRAHRHRICHINGDVSSAMAFNPLIYRKT
jgi:hypothetical protein